MRVVFGEYIVLISFLEISNCILLEKLTSKNKLVLIILNWF